LEHWILVTDKKAPAFTWSEFQTRREKVGKALDDLTYVFPEFPDVREGALEENKDAKISAFIQSFQSKLSEKRLSQDATTHLINVLDAVREAVVKVESYSRAFFTKMSRFERTEQLIERLKSAPGHLECAMLTSVDSDGKHKMVSLFEGAPCRPKAFKKDLTSFVNYSSYVAGSGLLGLVIEELEKYLQLPKEKKNWDSLKKDLTNLTEKGIAFEPDIRKKWNEAITFLYSEKSPWKALLEPGVSGAQRYDYLLRLFSHFKIDLIREAGGYSVAGFSPELIPELTEAKAQLKSFETNVEGFFNQSILGKMPDTLQRIDGRYESCPMLGKEFYREKDLTPEINQLSNKDWALRSPWLLSSQQLLSPIPVEVPSPNGMPRLAWYHEVEINNAYTAQNKLNRPEELLAGMIVYTTRKLTIPNLVYSRWLLGKPITTKPEDYGLSDNETGFLEAAIKTYQLPNVESLLSSSVVALQQMLVKFVMRQSLIARRAVQRRNEPKLQEQ
jgi:hypothetical protein